MSERQLALVAFLQAQNCSNYAGSWRHPSTMHDFTDARYYQRIARTLEDAKFDMAFFDDRLAMPDVYGGDPRLALEHGIRVVKLDPVVVMSMMAAVTRNLGLGATCSTTYYEPYHVARMFGTFDLMSNGRGAWNVVTSLNDSEAANFGHDSHLGHDERYDRAEEFMEVVQGLWGSWDADALVMDRQSGLFADPAKVHALNHQGRFFQSRGPLTVPQSAQGRPVILQAGQSGRGMAFAARWGEVIFATYTSIDMGQKTYARFKQAVSDQGRNPDKVKVCPACYVVIGESEEAAQARLELAQGIARPEDGLVLMSESLNYDFSARTLDEPFTDNELGGITGLRATLDRVISLSGKPNPTLSDFLKHSGRGTLNDALLFVGTPKSVADQMEEWFTQRACDGFVIAATHMPGAYEDVARLLVPELQRRGLFRKEYGSCTLRGNLGLD